MTHTDRWTLLIHGGAGGMRRGAFPADQDARCRAGLRRALDAGRAILAASGDALDAVEAAVRVLEDDPGFNAGRGSVFTHEGVNELDAAVMRGSDRAAGAVTGVTRTRHPVSLARKVMERSDHVLLSGDGADRFSLEQGLEQVEPGWFRTEERWRQLEEMKARGEKAFDVDVKYGTVGAVARDVRGHVAAATSTGGLTAKRWGRIGDSPLIGAGTYADDRAAAVSATGAGEYFIRAGAAHEVCARVRLTGEPLQAATDAVAVEIADLGGKGGMIAVAPDGTGIWSFTTAGMFRGRTSDNESPRVAIYADE